MPTKGYRRRFKIICKKWPNPCLYFAVILGKQMKFKTEKKMSFPSGFAFSS